LYHDAPPSTANLAIAGSLFTVSLESSEELGVDSNMLTKGNFFRRSVSVEVPGGYTFPSFVGLVLSRPDRRGPGPGAPPGASPGGGGV